MKQFLFLTLLCCTVLVSGCVRFPNAEKDSDPAPVPIGDPLDPKSADSEDEMQDNSKGTFQAKFETSKGEFIVEVYRAWSPLGAERFYKLVESGYFNENRFFRQAGFIVQFGISGDPAISKEWRDANIKDDPVVKSNTYGTITYAKAGPNTRTTQLFINFKNNEFLDGQGFSPFGRVIEGMDRVENLETKYGEQPDQGKIQSQGNKYLNAAFPDLDYIKKATIISETKPGEKSGSQKAAESQKTDGSTKKETKPEAKKVETPKETKPETKAEDKKEKEEVKKSEAKKEETTKKEDAKKAAPEKDDKEEKKEVKSETKTEDKK